VDTTEFDGDGVDSRRKLLVFVVRRVLGWDVADLKRAFTTTTTTAMGSDEADVRGVDVPCDVE
jgi:hypothetical protein